MSRLDQLKKEIRDKGEFVCEVQIDWLARNTLKIESLQKEEINDIKDQFKKKSS